MLAKPIGITNAQFLEAFRPCGFPDKSECTISFDDGNRRLTIAPVGASFRFTVAGNRFVKTAPETIDIPDIDGTYYIYYDIDGVLSYDTSMPNLLVVATVSIICWDATNNKHVTFQEERHEDGYPASVHSWAHFTIFTRFEQGLEAGDYTTTGNGGADAHAQLSIADGIIADEDLVHLIEDDDPQNLDPIAYIPVLYRSGATGAWRRDTATAFPVKQGVNRIAYNDPAGPWTTPDATANGRYIAMWIIASPDIEFPIMAILGQREDTTLANAQANNTWESLALGTLPFEEIKVIWRLIFQTSVTYGNTPHARLRDVTDYRVVSNLPGNNYVPTTHQSLTDRDVYNPHPNLSWNPNELINDHTAQGIHLPGQTVDTNALGFGAVLKLAADGNWDTAKADAEATMPVTALALESGTGDDILLLLKGIVRDDSWTWTPGGIIYADDTVAGDITQTAPADSGDVVQILGIAITSTVILFDPNLAFVELL